MMIKQEKVHSTTNIPGVRISYFDFQNKLALIKLHYVRLFEIIFKEIQNTVVSVL